MSGKLDLGAFVRLVFKPDAAEVSADEIAYFSESRRTGRDLCTGLGRHRISHLRRRLRGLAFLSSGILNCNFRRALSLLASCHPLFVSL